MKIRIDNKSIELLPQHFRHQGGQGSIYIVGNDAFKIYFDEQNVCPEKKIKELSIISNSKVIKPEKIVKNSVDKNVGFMMRALDDTNHILCELFTADFKKTKNITQTNIALIIENLKNIITDIHKSKILIVDLNELNFLVSPDFRNVYAIDVDSYQTQSFPARVIMPSIRDFHSSNFNELTDWYSFGILACQLLVGIHPYKGKYKGETKPLEERMRENISIFNKDVTIPKICDLNNIPSAYKDWFKVIFETKKRVRPPDDFVEVIFVPKKIDNLKRYESNKLKITFIADAKNLIDVVNDVLIFRDNFVIPHNILVKKETDEFKAGQVFIGKESFIWIFKNKLISILDKNQNVIETNIIADDAVTINGFLIIRRGNFFIKLKGEKILGKEIFSCEQITYELFNYYVSLNCIIQNISGTYCVITHLDNKTFSVKLNSSERILDCKCENNILMYSTISFNGAYTKHLVFYSSNFEEKQEIKFPDVSNPTCSFVFVNDVVIFINDAEKLECVKFLGDNKPPIWSLISDNFIDSNCTLFKYNNKLVAKKFDQLFQIETK